MVNNLKDMDMLYLNKPIYQQSVTIVKEILIKLIRVAQQIVEARTNDASTTKDASSIHLSESMSTLLRQFANFKSEVPPFCFEMCIFS